MSYLVLARKYRPQRFDQVIEQDHITQTLSNAIDANRVAHAILFSGPRGTGKTTVARILAKAMNCMTGPKPVPCNECQSCLEITSGNAVDVFEIDGASNNSVDQVRELRENVKYMPAHSLYKIYIIDEVHMLSIPAFNALLKTLEEPPSHVMFVFATTEPHKIPITILSRCQRHDFRRIKLDSVSKHLRFLCEQEGFAIGAESLEVIARESGGSMRDAISLLDQLMSCSQGSINHQQVLDILGVVDREYIFSLSGAILRRDITGILDTLDDIYNRGHNLLKLYSDLLEHFRNLLVVNIGKKVHKLVDLPDHEIDQMLAQSKHQSMTELHQIFDLLFQEESSVKFAAQPKLAMEMVFIKLVRLRPALSIDELIDKLDGLRNEIESSPQPRNLSMHQVAEKDDATALGRALHQDRPERTSVQSRHQQRAKSESDLSGCGARESLGEAWNKLFDYISQENPSLAASLTKCSLKKIADDRIEIEAAGNGFTINMIRRDKNMAFLKQACADFFGKEKQIILKTKIDPEDEKKKKKDQNNIQKQKALSHPLVADAIEIFDGKLIDVKLH